MPNSKEVSEFLTSLRAALTPEKAGLTFFAGERRVAGLRREEAAQLSGVSTAYYTRMERGDLSGVSESVLHALARGLQLDEAQTMHLFDLAKHASGSRQTRQASFEGQMTSRVGQLIDAMGNVPAIAMNRLSEPVGSNALGRALFPDLFPQGRLPLNHSRYLFLDPRSKVFYPDWETSARDVVSSLRLLVGQSQGDQALLGLVAELADGSTDFRKWWGSHTVRIHSAGAKRINHPVVGEVTVTYEVLQVTSVPGVRLVTYLAEPGTSSADALDMLRSWSVTFEKKEVEAK
jgi:transcriptional regulator with XRE-family HTH domain